MKPILFLDIDGVLNSHRFLTEESRDTERPGNMIDPKAVAILDEICSKADCDIVLSSSWRIAFPLPRISQLLRSKGLGRDLKDKTPSSAKGIRGVEIQTYLDGLDRIPSICILDDSTDMARLKPWLVRTSWKNGLRKSDVKQALKAFAKKPPSRTLR